jgi:hypothetical protein
VVLGWGGRRGGGRRLCMCFLRPNLRPNLQETLARPSRNSPRMQQARVDMKPIGPLEAFFLIHSLSHTYLREPGLDETRQREGLHSDRQEIDTSRPIAQIDGYEYAYARYSTVPNEYYSNALLYSYCFLSCFSHVHLKECYMLRRHN